MSHPLAGPTAIERLVRRSMAQAYGFEPAGHLALDDLAYVRTVNVLIDAETAFGVDLEADEAIACGTVDRLVVWIEDQILAQTARKVLGARRGAQRLDGGCRLYDLAAFRRPGPLP